MHSTALAKIWPWFTRRAVLEFLPSSQDRNLFCYIQFSVLLLVLGEVKGKAIWSASTIKPPCITETFHLLLTPLTYLHIFHSPFFPKITSNAETKHDSCSYLKNTSCLECSNSFLLPKHSLQSIFLLKHFVVALSFLIFFSIFPFLVPLS